MNTYAFTVTIDSERPLTPRDLMEAFEGSETIRLEEDFVLVTVAPQPEPFWFPPISNPGSGLVSMSKAGESASGDSGQS